MAWADDGSLLALRQRGPNQILLIDCDTGLATRVVKDIRGASWIYFQGSSRDFLLFVHSGPVLKYHWANDSLHEIYSFGERVWDWDLTADGKLVIAALGFAQPRVQVLDVEAGKKMYEIEVETGDRRGTVVSFAPDGASFAVGTLSGSLRLHETSTGRLISQLAFPRPLRDSPHSITQLAFSPDAKTLAALESELAGVAWWDLRTGSIEITELDAELAHLSLAYAPNGSEVAVGLPNGLISIRDARTRRELGKVDVHESAVYCLRYAPDSRLLGSISMGQRVAFTNRS
jgi:WD40 repeat protein